MPDYTSELKADLEAEATARGIDISDAPTKAELVERLEADDARRASAEAPQTTTADVAPSDETPEPLPTDVPALGAIQQEIRGHTPTPYPSDQDKTNRVEAANAPGLVHAPPPIEDLTVIGEVNVDEVNVGQSTRSS